LDCIVRCPNGGAARVPDREQPVSRRQLEDLHAAELALAGLARDVDDEIAIPHPGAATASEADIVELAERLLFLGRFVQRRAEHLSQQQLGADQNQAGNRGRAGNALSRHARCPDHDELTPPRQLPETEQ
jgi:hypothetical protein